MEIGLRNDICRKLRATVKKFGQEKINSAVIIGSEYAGEVGGVKYIYAPTIPGPILAKCDFKMARYFEDV